MRKAPVMTASFALVVLLCACHATPASIQPTARVVSAPTAEAVLPAPSATTGPVAGPQQETRGLLRGAIDGLRAGDRVRLWVEAEDDAQPEASRPVLAAWTAGNGAWQQEIASLPPGRHRLRAEAEGYVTTGHAWAFEVPGPGIVWRQTQTSFSFLECDAAAGAGRPGCEQFSNTVIEVPQAGLLGDVGGLAPGQIATVTLYFWPPQQGESFEVPWPDAGEQSGAPFPPPSPTPARAEVTVLDALPPAAAGWAPVAELQVTNGRWGLIDLLLEGRKYLVTACAAGRAAAPLAYQVILFGQGRHSLPDGVDFAFAPGREPDSCRRPAPVATAGTGGGSAASFRLDSLPLAVDLPPGWAAAQGPESLAGRFTGLVAFNSWGQAREWLAPTTGGDYADSGSYTRVWQLPPGGAYVALLQAGVPPRPAWSSEADRVGRELDPAWWVDDCRKSGAADYQGGGTFWIPFQKWGRDLELEVYCRADASDATAAAVKALLASWRFDPAFPGDAGWATSQARWLLPRGVNRATFPGLAGPLPAPGQQPLARDETRGEERWSTEAYAEGQTAIVTFRYRWALPAFDESSRQKSAHGSRWWRVAVGPDGRAVVQAEGGEPIPGLDVPPPVQAYYDPLLGFSLDYPAGWQVLPVAGQGQPDARRFLVVGFDGPIHPFGDQAMGNYSFSVSVGPAAAETVTGSLEATLAPMDESVRSLVGRRCCATLGGQPALEVTYPGFMAGRWGAVEWLALHDGREYRVRFQPTYGLEGDTLDDILAQAARDTVVRTFAFLPVAGTPLPRRPGESPRPEPAVTPSPTVPPVPLPPGLVYRTSDGLWRVGPGGQADRLLDETYGVALSPDGKQAFYFAGGDLWLADLDSGERRNVTATTDREEFGAQWWPARPGVAVMMSWEPGTRAHVQATLSCVTTVNLDGSGYHVVEPGDCPGGFALSPDGETIAYALAGAGRLYHWGGVAEPFDPARHGLTGTGRPTLYTQSWSPDGRLLAWVMDGEFDGRRRVALVVFDLEAGTARVLHSYPFSCVGCQPPGAAWSPDGRWLAFYATAQAPEEAGTWIVRADGGEEHRLDGSDAVWGPDGKWLAISRVESGGPDSVWLLEVGTWQGGPLALPGDILTEEWRNP